MHDVLLRRDVEMEEARLAAAWDNARTASGNMRMTAADRNPWRKQAAKSAPVLRGGARDMARAFGVKVPEEARHGSQ